MTSEDEWERSLMDDDAVGRAEATEAELMPKVLSGLGKTLATISTTMLNMEKSIKRLRPVELSDSEDRPRKKRRQTSQSEAQKVTEGLLQCKEAQANLAHEGNSNMTLS